MGRSEILQDSTTPFLGQNYYSANKEGCSKILSRTKSKGGKRGVEYVAGRTTFSTDKPAFPPLSRSALQTNRSVSGWSQRCYKYVFFFSLSLVRCEGVAPSSIMKSSRFFFLSLSLSLSRVRHRRKTRLRRKSCEWQTTSTPPRRRSCSESATTRCWRRGD